MMDVSHEDDFYQSFETHFFDFLNEQKSLTVCDVLLKAQMYDSALKLWHKIDKVGKSSPCQVKPAIQVICKNGPLDPP